MFIGHIALYASDLERMKNFYIKYFGAAAGKKYRNEKTGFESYFLSFGNGAKIEVMTKPQTEHPKQYGVGCFGYDHIAVNTGSRDTVYELTKLLENDGYTVISAPRTTGDGYYESCVLDPEGNHIEITV
jgi:lactoylglutathione lyase